MLDSNAQCYRDIEKKVRRSRAEGSPRKEAEDYPREDYPKVVVSAMGHQDHLMSGSGVT